LSAENAFQLLNLAVLPWWGVWLVAPRSGLALRAASHGAVFVGLATLYTVLLGATIAAGGSDGGLDFDGLRAVLAEPVGFLAGWTHYLCFDLFVGAWIVREARRLDVEPRAYLFFTLMAGPIGLGGFLLRRAWRLRSLGQIGEVDLA
jgi:hypothetical protein